MRKLPVWSTILGAYDFVWYERRPFLTLALPAIAILTILTIMLGAIRATASVILSTIGAGASPEGAVLILGLGIFGRLGLGLAMLAIWVTFCVAWHRHYLVPEEVATIQTALRWGRRQYRFLLIVIGVGALLVLPLIIGDALSIIIIEPIALPVGFIGAMYIMARLALLFPATAVDHRMSFGECWMFTRGNGWRLFLVIGLVSSPFEVTIILIEFASWPELVVAFADQALSFIAFSVGVSALSIAYRFISCGSSAGTTSGIVETSARRFFAAVGRVVGRLRGRP